MASLFKNIVNTVKKAGKDIGAETKRFAKKPVGKIVLGAAAVAAGGALVGAAAPAVFKGAKKVIGGGFNGMTMPKPTPAFVEPIVERAALPVEEQVLNWNRDRASEPSGAAGRGAQATVRQESPTAPVPWWKKWWWLIVIGVLMLLALLVGRRGGGGNG